MKHSGGNTHDPEHHSLDDRTRREPSGPVTISQLNRIFKICWLYQYPEMTKASSPEEINMAAADIRAMNLAPDPLYKMIEEELAKRISPESMGEVENSILPMRHRFATLVHQALNNEENNYSFPDSWDEMHHRGLAAQAWLEDWISEAREDKNDHRIVQLYASCFGQVWYRLEQIAYGEDGKLKKGKRGQEETITATQFNVLKDVSAEAITPVIRRYLGKYLFDDLNGFNTQDKLDFISEYTVRYIRGQLTLPETDSHFPETWREYNQRLASGKKGFLSFLEQQCNEFGFDLIGHEKELEASYDDVAKQLALMSKSSAITAHSWIKN